MRTTVVQWPFLLFGLPDSSHSSFESLAPVCTFCLHTGPICLTHVQSILKHPEASWSILEQRCCSLWVLFWRVLLWCHPVRWCLCFDCSCHVLTAGRYEQVRNHSTPLALFAIGTSKSSNIALLGHSFRTATLCLHLGPYVSHTAHQGTHLRKTGGLFMIAHYCAWLHLLCTWQALLGFGKGSLGWGPQ